MQRCFSDLRPDGACQCTLGVLGVQVAEEAGGAVRQAKVQDWQPREPPRSAAGLSAWADGLVAYLQVSCIPHSDGVSNMLHARHCAVKCSIQQSCIMGLSARCHSF